MFFSSEYRILLGVKADGLLLGDLRWQSVVLADPLILNPTNSRGGNQAKVNSGFALVTSAVGPDNFKMVC